VVDDERPIVMVIETNLKISGYEVLTAYNGRDAVELVRSQRPDLVLLDVIMPEMDGWEALQQIRGDQDPEIASTPIVMLTALDRDRDILRGYEYGVDIYLTKPFEPEELLEIVARVLEARDEDRFLDSLGSDQ
jgi:two-component system alkaline phosphatase synthesis response regulator PhoP/two-component system response regulator VicR